MRIEGFFLVSGSTAISALLCACIYVPVETTPAETARDIEQTSSGALTVKGLRFDLPDGTRSKAISVFVDGARVGRCELAETNGDVCVDGHRLTPGSHAIDIAITCQNTETLRWLGCGWNLWDRIVIAPRERVTVDVAGSIAHPDEQERYVSRRRGDALDAPGCIQTLEELAFTPSCTLVELVAASALADQAARQCSRRQLEGAHRTVARRLLAIAVENHFQPRIEQCFSVIERRRGPGRVPPGVTQSWRGDVVEGGSWRWARAVLPTDAGDDMGPEAQLDVIRDGLRAARPRVEALQEVIEAFLDDANVPTLLRHAMDEPWSFDPESPAGHRHQWIVAARWHSEEYDSYLIDQVTGDGSLHCANYQAVERLLPYFLEADHLSRETWEAIRSMIERTPAEERVQGRCTHVFSPRRTGDVSLEDRLRWLAEWDCSDRRHPARRSQTLEAQLRPGNSPHSVPDELRRRLYDELEDCFPGPPPAP